jgi:flagellar biogenesis protein FliO
MGLALVASLLGAVGVLALAVGALRLLAPRGGRGPLKVVARLSLDPRRSLVLVDAAGRYLLLGLGDGAPALVAELEAERVAAFIAAEQPVGAPLVEALRGLFAKRGRA